MTWTSQCDDCEGAGGWCSTCGESPDNCDCDACDCEVDAWSECGTCQGRGEIESDDPSDHFDDEPTTPEPSR